MKVQDQHKIKHETQSCQTSVSGSFITDVETLTNDILKYFPKFFDDFENWEYGNGKNAGKDFKKIFNKAKRLNSTVYKIVIV